MLAVLNWSSIYGAIQQLLGSMNSLLLELFCLYSQCSHEKLEDQFEKFLFKEIQAVFGNCWSINWICFNCDRTGGDCSSYIGDDCFRTGFG